VVDMADGAHIRVRLVAFEFSLAHDSSSGVTLPG
jgi:hypothetical protein